MNSVTVWGLGLAISVALHAGALVVIPHAFSAEPIVDQPLPRSEMRVETQAVARSESSAVAPPSDPAAVAPSTGANLSQGAIPQVRATASALDESRVVSTAVDATANLAASAPPTTLAVPQTPPPAILSAEPQVDVAVAPAEAPVASLVPAVSDGSPIAAREPDVTVATISEPPPATVSEVLAGAEQGLEAAQIQTAAIAQVDPAGTTAAPVDDAASAIAVALPQASTVPQSALVEDAVPQAQPEATRIAAELAFIGEGDVAIDPQALAMIQSFMQSGDPGAEAAKARDALEALLSQVPCSRLQAEFDPENGTLALRGHIPEEDLREPLLAALQAQVGQGIVVTDAMLILPRPQCGALAGIGAVGLPQSTDQVTNRRIVGNDAHARVFNYRGGDSLVLEMQAPDYDAYVYVDYYDAAGNVIHLVPNETVPLSLHPTQSTMIVGRAADGQPALEITIGPPYGQEIAVAFASSEPLYDGLRPTVEAAGPYLAWLAERVAEKRAANPSFKGEWVYFFVATRAE